MQTNDGGALFYGLNAVGGAYDDRLCTERHHQRAGQQHGTDRAVHLGHFMRQQDESGNNVHQIVLFYRIAQHLRRVHRQRFTGIGAAARVQNAADTVAAGVKIHQSIEIFAYVALFQFVTGHPSHPRFSPQRLFCRCRRSIRAGPRSESLSAWRGLCRPRACRPLRRRAGRSWRTTSR